MCILLDFFFVFFPLQLLFLWSVLLFLLNISTWVYMGSIYFFIFYHPLHIIYLLKKIWHEFSEIFKIGHSLFIIICKNRMGIRNFDDLIDDSHNKVIIDSFLSVFELNVRAINEIVCNDFHVVNLFYHSV